MKNIIIVLILLFTTFVFADHDDVKVIVPVMYEGWNLLGFSLQPHVVSDSVVSTVFEVFPTYMTRPELRFSWHYDHLHLSQSIHPLGVTVN